MKKLILLTLSVLASTFVFAQEEEAPAGSLIADIMNVAPVQQEMDETTVEADTEYQANLEEETSNLEELLSKTGEKFKEDVSEVIETFNKVLEKGVENDVNVEKRRVTTSVNALSMSLLSQKKKLLMDFNGKMTQNIRKLPRVLVSDKEKELKEKIDEYKVKFDEEFGMNQDVIKGFKETVHLIKSEDAPASEEGGEQ